SGGPPVRFPTGGSAISPRAGTARRSSGPPPRTGGRASPRSGGASRSTGAPECTRPGRASCRRRWRAAPPPAARSGRVSPAQAPAPRAGNRTPGRARRNERRDGQASTPPATRTGTGKGLLLERLVEECPKRLRGRIVAQAEVRVDLVVGGLPAAEEGDG